MNKNDHHESNPTVINGSAYNDSKEIGDDFGSVIEADRTLARKMALVDNAIDEIGFTSYQMKLFFLNGFGYAVDSLLILLNGLTQPQIALQYHPMVSKAQTIAVGIGLLFGALFWGLGADVSLLFV
jgi:hypothetical protein